MDIKPWDARIAAVLVRPLADTAVTPNHITTLSLLLSLTAGVLFATGDPRFVNMAAILSMLHELIDHCDGELARMTGKVTRFGHYYDLISDFVHYIVLFMGIGIGLRGGTPGDWTLAMGGVIGISVCIIFGLLWHMQVRCGSEQAQPGFAGFEVQDLMYLIGPVTWLGGLQTFFYAAFIGTPLFALWMLRDYRRCIAAGITDKPVGK